MAEQVVVNAAEIAAARAREAQRVNALAKAEADVTTVRSSATKIYGSTISPIVKSMTAATQQALKDLQSKSGTISKSTKDAIAAASAANKAIQPEIKTQLADYTSQYNTLQGVISNLSTPVSIPTATSTTSERVYYARRVLSVQQSQFSLARTTPTTFPVTFRLLPDAAYAGSEYGKIIDRVLVA